MDSDVLVHDRAASPSRLSATLPSHVECVHRNVGACACAPFVMSQHLSLGPPLMNQKREEDVGCVGIGPVPGARVLDDLPGAGPRCALTPVRRPVLEGRTLRGDVDICLGYTLCRWVNWAMLPRPEQAPNQPHKYQPEQSWKRTVAGMSSFQDLTRQQNDTWHSHQTHILERAGCSLTK